MQIFPANKIDRLPRGALIDSQRANQVQNIQRKPEGKLLRDLPIIIEQVEKDPTTRKFEIMTFVHSDLPEKLEVGSELVHDSVWYPGNDQLEIQILNDKPKDIVIAGTFNDRIWKPKNIFQVSDTGTHAQDQARLLKQIKDSQVECRFAWGNMLEAFVIIQDLNLSYKNLATVGYDIRMIVTRKVGLKETQVKVDTAVEIQQAINEITTIKPQIDSPPIGIVKFVKDAYDFVVEAYYTALDWMNKAFQAWSTLQSVITSVTEAIDSVFNVIKTALAFIERARGSLADLRLKLDSWEAISHSAVNRMRDLLNIQTWIGALRHSAFKADRHLKNSHDTLATLAESLILAVHRVQQGETLYTLSELYYGSPFYINDIIVFNKLTSPSVAPGTLLGIPKRQF